MRIKCVYFSLFLHVSPPFSSSSSFEIFLSVWFAFYHMNLELMLNNVQNVYHLPLFCFAINGILSFLLDLLSRCGVILLFANILVMIVCVCVRFPSFSLSLSFIRGQCVERKWDWIALHSFHCLLKYKSGFTWIIFYTSNNTLPIYVCLYFLCVPYKKRFF